MSREDDNQADEPASGARTNDPELAAMIQIERVMRRLPDGRAAHRIVQWMADRWAEDDIAVERFVPTTPKERVG